jgi:hypothetical protein
LLGDARVTTTTTIDFKSEATGADLTVSRDPERRSTPGSTPLQVILAAVGVRNPMSPSSGAKVLSPGGSTASLVTVTFFDAANASISQCIRNPIPAPAGAPRFQCRLRDR